MTVKVDTCENCENCENCFIFQKKNPTGAHGLKETTYNYIHIKYMKIRLVMAMNKQSVHLQHIHTSCIIDLHKTYNSVQRI